ncbi:amidohydrolase [Bradyrhizobium uaiense]|uniref:Amidohydrolase n=1 Tax=Bradyrhizobium uaiense TaxID=2594946 RepID=A0A6P1BU46_9BRAD|nr:amidohydrolase [Bradyrhizobium uaiense]NEV01839.1 amidohydrolase [Bradyrhizobium uaiense]
MQIYAWEGWHRKPLSPHGGLQLALMRRLARFSRAIPASVDAKIGKTRFEGVANMHRGPAECIVRTGEPPVINDAEMVRRFRQVAHETLGGETLTTKKRAAGSDDFGFYAACVPSM